MWRESGFAAEADAMAEGAGPSALSDALIDSFCLIGPLPRCREPLAEYREAGVGLPPQPTGRPGRRPGHHPRLRRRRDARNASPRP
jgi:hypothetical protein